MFEKITESDIEKRSVAALANTPNRRVPYGESGMDAAQLKARFDLLPKHIAARLNEIFDGLEDGSLADTLSIGTGEKKVTLGAFVDSLLKGNVEDIKIGTIYETISLLQLGALVIEMRDGLKTGELADKMMLSEEESLREFCRKTNRLTDMNIDAIAKSVLETFGVDGEYNSENNKLATVSTVVNKLAEVVANAPDDLNTLKEIADYIASDKIGAAEINNTISNHDMLIANNESDILKINGEIETIEKKIFGHPEFKNESQGLDLRPNQWGGYTVYGVGGCADTILVIPREYQGLPVNDVIDYAFYYDSHLKSVYIPNTLISGMYSALPYGITVYLEATTVPDGWYPDWDNGCGAVYYGVIGVGIVSSINALNEQIGDISAVFDELHTYAQGLVNGGGA